MALKFQIAESPCTLWRTKLPRIDTYFESQTLSLGTFQLKFRLDCCFDNFDLTEYFRLYLINCHQRKFAMILSVYVENNKHRRKACFSGLATNDKPISNLKMKSLKDDFGISGDEISFLFIFEVDSVRERAVEKTGPSQSASLQPEAPRIQSSCLQTFSEDIEKLFENPDYSDAVVKCGDKIFFVNRNILSVRSEVFAAMFRNKLKESETGVVDIPNVEPNVMEQFLHYVYSGRVEALSMTTAFSLYQISDLYNVPSLKRKCASFLADSLSEDVVCQVLQLAQQFENKELLEFATSFVTTKAEFIKSTSWKTFANDYPGIAVKVYMKLHGN